MDEQQTAYIMAMSIQSGVNNIVKTKQGDKTMSEKSIKAVCTSNVYTHWGRTDDPKDLTEGKEYTVDYVVIHGSYTQTILVGDPEHAYNSCNFDFFDKDGKEIDIVDYFHHKIGMHRC